MMHFPAPITIMRIGKMSRIDRIEALFHEARSLPEGRDRAAWVALQCGTDPDLLEEVVSLLDAHAKIQLAGQLPPTVAPVLPVGLFGAYRAVEFLGRGGTSAVYRAQRADNQFDQVVALKVMAGYPGRSRISGAQKVRHRTPSARLAQPQ